MISMEYNYDQEPLAICANISVQMLPLIVYGVSPQHDTPCAARHRTELRQAPNFNTSFRILPIPTCWREAAAGDKPWIQVLNSSAHLVSKDAILLVAVKIG